MANVADDADDLRRLIAASHRDALPDGILVGIKLPRHLLADDGYPRAVGGIRIREIAARLQWNAHGFEIAGRGRIIHGAVALARRLWGLADQYAGVRNMSPPDKGKMFAAPADVTPGQCADVFESPFVERRLLGVFRIFGVGQVGAEGQHAVRIEAGVHALQAVKAAHQQPRAREQHQRQSDFAGYQNAAQAVALEADRVAASAFAQRGVQIGARHLQRGRQAEENAGQYADGGGERHRAHIESDLRGARQNAGIHADQARACPPTRRPSRSPYPCAERTRLSVSS